AGSIGAAFPGRRSASQREPKPGGLPAMPWLRSAPGYRLLPAVAGILRKRAGHLSEGIGGASVVPQISGTAESFVDRGLPSIELALGKPRLPVSRPFAVQPECDRGQSRRDSLLAEHATRHGADGAQSQKDLSQAAGVSSLREVSLRASQRISRLP